MRQPVSGKRRAAFVSAAADSRRVAAQVSAANAATKTIKSFIPVSD